MPWNIHGTNAVEGDLAELVGMGFKHFIITLKKGGALHTHRGIVHHDELIDKPWGSKVYSHLGNPFYLMQPSLADLIRDTPRITQIMYPKDIGFIMVTMGIGPGMHVIEAGTGSGGLTTAFAYAVGDSGRVFSYENREEMQRLAKKNIERLGISERVEFKLKDISDGFEETGVDALFLDLPNPYDFMSQVKTGLKPGGFFGTILPTTNQVIRFLPELRRSGFSFIEVLEIILRYYKPESDRFRPVDRMVAHTGFLIFARLILEPETSETSASDASNETSFSDVESLDEEKD
jgi:tRNA (adenine57-N1/adenine58-N1)-methyltransferase